MTDAPLVSAMFSFVSVFYGLLVPLMTALTLAVVFIASMLHPGAKPYGVGSAVFHYVMQGLGILLMTTGALPTITSVLAGVELTGATYFTLLLVFAAGGVLFLWHDNTVRTVDSASRAVPGAIFLYTIKIIGYLIIILWSLSVITIVVGGTAAEAGWWIMPLVMIVYGSLLSLCTHSGSTDPHLSVFKSISMNQRSASPSAKKPVKKAAVKKRKR
ncbi:hypothetical protein COU78_03365 [Candidatus Peregrinibacteria bacterium CG10_big_fil_rev_8_21_14_0_10_49_24]|nr:MAG: hypothetical protein COV83_05185 [Candidatus Peregrinibacteria bacterium CG11_big_fil_rev_8_21_14_0_20_49_14]PIR51159.1 MAG: hypothetical protein COU78_03365 [Candidatus Peregrinibacteria bacterium CG10_big_fil_rev_8_21_14_0_10_49_24]PJA67198.1 MAG: hypothetical protein CO157_05520 [Candidatus Peregrinibacteria bacterium CG_4_9_14_3_um_filter_49_12]